MRLQNRSGVLPLCALLAATLVGCATEDATPSPPTEAPPSVVVTATPGETAAPTPVATPTEPPLALDVPEEHSEIPIEFDVTAAIPAQGLGELLVTVTNRGEETIDEIALRFPTALYDQLYLAPFEPSPDRMINPLVVPWTRWVEGPGQRGEPAGTITIGYGPIEAGTTLEIPLVARRRTDGPIEFDLQLLNREAILRLEDGEPTQARVQIPPP